MYERFEMLGSLASLEQHTKAEVQQQLASNPQYVGASMVVERAGWDKQNTEKLLAELQLETMRTALLEAGFAKGDPELIDLCIQNFRRISGRMFW